MRKTLFLLFLINTSFAYGDTKTQSQQIISNEDFISAIETTYDKVLKETKFEDRKQLVDQLKERAIEMQQNLMKKEEKSDADGTAMFHVDIFRRLYGQLNTIDQDKCLTSAKNLKFSLYRTRPEDEIFPFEESLYNLFGKMCSTEFPLLTKSIQKLSS